MGKLPVDPPPLTSRRALGKNDSINSETVASLNPNPSHPRVNSVKPLPGKLLRVRFNNNEERLYDCSPLLAEDAFAPLKDETLFRRARADAHGYGVVWNDDIDLSESELWINGESAIARPHDAPAN